MSKLIRIFKFTVVAAVLLGFSTFIKTDYLVVRPGSAEDLRPLVEVEGADVDDTGRFFLVTVSQQQASLLMAVYGYLHPHMELQQLTSVIPPDMELEEYQEIMRQWMRESQLMAQVIALRRTGFEVQIESNGVAVRGFLEGSPSLGYLQEDDAIVAIDGHPVFLADQVISRVQDRAVGDEVRVTVRRGGEVRDFVIPTMPKPDNPRVPALGVYIHALEWEPVIPIDIDIKTGDIGGPSAGMMFVLEIINQLQEEDLTRGRFIAGTGTIDYNEKVGEIGGVRQKVVAAEQAGAEYFIVPAGNYDDALQAARRIEVARVEKLQDVLDFLAGLPPAGDQ